MKKIYTYEDFKGNKGTFLADSLEEAKEIYRKDYPNEGKIVSEQKINGENAIQTLKQANNTLQEVLLQIKEINKEEQFDFCTSSRLAEVTCGSENLIEEISKIVFQRDCRNRRR